MAIQKIKIIGILLRIYRVLTPGQRQKALLNAGLVLGNAFLEVFSLAAALPLLALLLDSSVIRANPHLNRAFLFFGFGSESGFVIAAALLLLLLFILKNGIGVFIHYYQSRFAYGVSSELSEQAFGEYYAREYTRITDTNSSLPTRDIIFIPTEFSIYVLLAAITLFSEGFILLLICAGIALYDPRVFLLLTVLLSPALFLVYRFKRTRLERIGRQSEELKPLSVKYLFQGIYAYIDAKLYARERYFQQRFSSVQRELNRSFALFNTLNALPARLLETIALLGMVSIVLYSLAVSDDRQEVILLLGVFGAGAYRVMPSINRILVALVNIKTFNYTLDILEESQRASSQVPPENPHPAAPLRFEKFIALHNVSFSYSDNPSFRLNRVNFMLKKGETVGLIGKSGSGKTTIINIMLRFLREQSGEILLDGRPLRPGDTTAWRSLIGYVKQAPFILDGSIKENVAFGEMPGGIDAERLALALEQAGLKDWIAALPQGVETQIGEQGAKLSGGQRQRIAIARALYRNSEILIFDEATSELDRETEREIVSAIESLSGQKKTILLVAHRVTTLKPCQRIYELKDGEIAGFYQYADLREREFEGGK
ncbi:MAG: ABC transporter ATP-binding protein [Calditrichaceae bacterium]|nr:ABC transporter ATP-binding protein/permease [Calditrichia bacterium]NUQ40478.1 ABC transporter ATP-binding protein [Calditrichaceae bacterium]